ncbi:hypothetical protein [Mycobacterium sp.]|uniref:hypothetical protein n=1 Tax=Mycobacterium sp. TaxID=1785 RepID=UPI003D09DC59
MAGLNELGAEWVSPDAGGVVRDPSTDSAQLGGAADEFHHRMDDSDLRRGFRGGKAMSDFGSGYSVN